jgi:hypothetical protein
MDWKVRIDRNVRMQDFNNTDKQKKCHLASNLCCVPLHVHLASYAPDSRIVNIIYVKGSFKDLYSKKDMKLVFSRFISRGEILYYSLIFSVSPLIHVE